MSGQGGYPIDDYGGGKAGYIPDSNGGMYGRMQPDGMGMMQGGYGQYSPGRQVGGQMGMGLRNMEGAQPPAGTAQASAPAAPGSDTFGRGPTDYTAMTGPLTNMRGGAPLPDQTNMAAGYGGDPGASGLLGPAPMRNPAMGLRNTPGSSMAPQSPPQMGMQMPPGLQGNAAPLGSTGNPWLTRQQLDAQSGDVNYGRPNPGLGDMGGMQQPGGNQDAGAYPPGFQFERGNSTLDPRSMEFLTRWMGGSNSPWGPTQQQQVDGYNNWYAQQYPRNSGPGNGGM